MTAVRTRRRRRWPIVLLVLAVLVAAGGLLAETLARDRVSSVASTALADRLGVPENRVDVALGPALVLPQLLSGRIDRVDVSASRLPVQGVTATFDGTLRGAALDGSAARSLTGTVTIPGSQLSVLAAQADGPKVDRIRADAPNLVADATASAFGVRVPVSVTLRPSAAAGAVVLTPTAVTVAGRTIDATALRSAPLSGVARTYLQPTRVCVADTLPSGLDLRSAKVVGPDLVLGLAGSDVALGGADTGSCG
ncbi:MAG: DUF2993 domain-containing protein [Micrococcales bacterium]|nr:DUF2993 domain-containing protein [Micrococcales bacterium]